MKTVNALSLRQNLGAVIRDLQKSGKPILLEKARVPVGVIISLADYQRKFVEHQASELRTAVIEKIKMLKGNPKKGETAASIIRSLRE